MPTQAPKSPGPTLSAFFQTSNAKQKQKQKAKRAPSPIDLTVDSDAEEGRPPLKRLRTALATPLRKSKTPAPPQTNAALTTWGFSPLKQAEASPSRPRTSDQQKKHEAFKKKLLADDPSRKKPRSSPTPSEGEIGDEQSQVAGDLDEPTVNPLEKYSRAGSSSQTQKTKAPARKGKQKLIGPSGEAYTPLELQVVQLKRENPGTLLMVEVGYKYKFFDDDAKIAAKELSIVCYPDRNFIVASIPEHRHNIHLKKLLSQGHRVGIVRQTETAALKKVGDNRNAPFERKLTHLYTAATYVDEIDSVDDVEKYSAPPLMCLIEAPKDKGTHDVSFGLLTIAPNTGDVVWDDFDDNAMRLELETRLVHIRPAELLIQEADLSPETEKMLTHFTRTSSIGHNTRIERFKRLLSYTEAFERVSDFYTDKKKAAAASENFRSGALMDAIAGFPPRVVIALAHAIQHLTKFGLADPFLETQFFKEFTTRAHMLLAANTLVNLEVYRNATDGTTKGSLMWVLDKTKTRFGARLLRNWVGRPLVDKRVLTDRIDAVTEILEDDGDKLVVLRTLLNGLPDLAKGLCRIQYGQCTPEELARLLPAFDKISKAFNDIDGEESVGLKSPVLNRIIASLPRLKGPVGDILRDIHVDKLRDGKKELLWKDVDKYPGIMDALMSIGVIDNELKEELRAIRKELKLPGLQWTSVANDDYLVEVRKDHRAIPDNWVRHSTRGQFVRLRPPSVTTKLEEQARFREMLAVEASNAYQSYLADISRNHYTVLRDAVNQLATADCLISFAQVALSQNYVRPEFTEDDSLEIVEGRHPMIEALRSDPYIANSITMGGDKPRGKILTGPNMGGKSSCVRMVALIALMAQIGSYVPAESVKMGLMDSILTRMGASDDLSRGRSTFMVEMSETSEILRTATNKSLVILDELGRGTSTVDGMAIASATLRYLLETTQCKTLFITHYPYVAAKMEQRFPGVVENVHMGYEAAPRADGTSHVVFLYRLTSGITSESFGIECGRLAGIPENILSRAVEQSDKLQKEVEERVRRNK